MEIENFDEVLKLIISNNKSNFRKNPEPIINYDVKAENLINSLKGEK